MFINQHKFIIDILEQAGLHDAKPFSLPVDQSIKLNDKDGPLLDDPSVGKIQLVRPVDH